MTSQTPISEHASMALASLAAHPVRTTASDIANGPYVVGAFGPKGIHKGLLELQDLHLAVAEHGRWRITPAGTERQKASGRL